MPRPASIWLRKQTGWYYVTFKGEKVKLSQDKKEAERLFHQLMAQKEEPEREPAQHLGPSFRKLADEFLVHTQTEKNAETLAIQTKILQRFCDRHKGLRAADLKGYTVMSWLAWENAQRAKKNKKLWNTSTQALAIKTIKAVCNWGVKQSYLKEHPIKRLSAGKVARRERLLTPEERLRIKERAKPNFRDFFTVVELTGARPYKEIGVLEAKDIDFEAGTATLTRHKTFRKTGKPRVIFFPPDALAIVKRLAEEYPTGPLFRTKRQSRWNQNNCMKWMYIVRESLGIAFCMYDLRHTWITNALIRGVPVEVVAELVGNTPQIIHKHYAHIAKDQSALRAAVLKAVG